MIVGSWTRYEEQIVLKDKYILKNTYKQNTVLKDKYILINTYKQNTDKAK